MADDVKLILDAHSTLGEGAIWDTRNQTLYWVDIEQGLVHAYDPAKQNDRSVSVGQSVGTVVPRKTGGLMLAVRDGFMSLNLETGKTSLVATPQSHNPDNRFNDGKCDPAGRFWAGTMETPRRKGALFRLDRDLSVHRMLEGVGCSNGIAWSLDNETMYYIDTSTSKIDAFQYDITTGAVSNRRTVVTVSESLGFPDGMTMDARGKLWVAHWDGWCVCCWNPNTGQLIRKVSLPVSRPTSCAFGGPTLDTLYITSATTGLDTTALKNQPGAGGIFCFDPGVQGRPAISFAG